VDPEDATVSQTDELSRVKARIKALTEKTIANGCTEAEAMAAAEMVGRLLERYALSMDAIEIRTARCIEVAVPLGGRRRRPIDGCVPAIARFCDCKVWLAHAASPDPMQQGAAAPGRDYVFFGFETDTALATYMFAVIDRAINGATMLARLMGLPVKIPCTVPERKRLLSRHRSELDRFSGALSPDRKGSICLLGHRRQARQDPLEVCGHRMCVLG